MKNYNKRPGRKLYINYLKQLNQVLKSNSKKLHSFEYLSCDFEFFRDWLESQFDSDMNWGNTGSYWHLDHVVPVSSFDIKNYPVHLIYEAFHWSNFQRLEGRENLRKHNKRNYDVELKQKIKAFYFEQLCNNKNTSLYL